MRSRSGFLGVSILICSLALLAVLVAAAGAARHPYLETFGSAAKPTFGAAKGIALDQATGDLLVIDAATGTVSRFAADGNPSNFPALGTNVIDGRTGADKTPEEELVFGNSNEVQVAIDNSGGAADGNIYVTQSGRHLIDIFSSDGAYVGQLTEAGTPLEPLGEATGVTVGADGTVYVSDYSRGVHSFAPGGSVPVNSDYVGTFSTVAEPTILASGSGATAGYLFVTSYSTHTISKIDATNGELAYLVAEGTNFSVTVDPATGHVYGANGSAVEEYDASAAGGATLVSRISVTGPTEGVAVGGLEGSVYLTKSASASERKGATGVEVYGALAPPTPFIESQSVKAVASSEGVLEAQINPEGSATSYFVEYGPSVVYGTSTPAENVGGDETSHTVQVSITGLNPGSVYHFRFVATNAIGVSESIDGTFRTTNNAAEPAVCANQIFRAGPSARLSNCRAYELVTPIEKGGLNIEPAVTLGSFRAALNQVATSGDALTYSTSQGFAAPEGVPYAPQYLATRGGSGWRSRSLSAAQNPSRYPAANRIDLEYRLFNPSLCTGALLNWSEPPVAPLAVNGAPNIYSRDICGNSGVLAVSTTPHRSEPEVGGVSTDGQCIVYYHNTDDLVKSRSLGEEGPGGIYEHCGGSTTRIDLLPDGTPTEGYVVPGSPATAPAPEQMLRLGSMADSVSGDASTVYWTDLSPPSQDAGRGQLFVRINSGEPDSALGAGNVCLEPTKACTLPVSAPVEGNSVQASFAAASKDGSRAFYFFRSGPVAGNLYEFDLATQSSRLIATDLAVSGAPQGNGGEPPIEPVMGVSDDGSRVYFFSRATLSGEGSAGELNLFLFEAASSATESTQLVATLPIQSNSFQSEQGPVQPAYFHSARVTPDGLHAVFTTDQPLTGYDNRAVGTGKRAVEVYTYDAATNGGDGSLSCVSCNPTGQRPQARRLSKPQEGVAAQSESEYASLIPGFYTTFHGARVITDDGSRVFFESFDDLVPRDTNGKADVYEWVEADVGGCTEQTPSFSPVNDGCLALVSSGQSPVDSSLIDATADGRDVFISTSQSLVPEDPGLVDIYDARSGGGFPAPGIPRVTCEGEACQVAPSPAAPLQSGSARFIGPANPHGKPKQRPKCRKSKKACKSHSKSGKNGKKSNRGEGSKTRSSKKGGQK